MPVQIHNKLYKTVAERLDEAHAQSDLEGVETEVLYLEPQIMVKATITTKKGTFTGISAADPNKAIEKKTPVEVAETSAVGRALAFAGYAGSEIASADEMYKAGVKSDSAQNNKQAQDKGLWCDYHKCAMRLNKNGKAYHLDRSRAEGDQFCNGLGFPSEKAEWQNKVHKESRKVDATEVADDIPFN